MGFTNQADFNSQVGTGKPLTFMSSGGDLVGILVYVNVHNIRGRNAFQQSKLKQSNC
jgi:hypothetical protein